MNMIDDLVVFLFEIAERESRKMETSAPTSREGYELEDTISLAVAEFREKKGYTDIAPYPPRYELDFPTLSGQKHQFDMVVRRGDDLIIVLECKRRKGISTKDQLVCFGGKLVDYGLGFRVHNQTVLIRGIFLSTASIPDSSAIYALGSAILPIAPNMPPVQYLLTKIDRSSSLWEPLTELKRLMSIPWPQIIDYAPRRDAREILFSYKQYYALWTKEVEHKDGKS